MNKHLVIIGAGPGLAFATAHRFATAGYSITLVGRTRSRLSELATNLATAGEEVSIEVADVTDHDGLRHTLRRIDDTHPVDAAIFQPSGGSDFLDVLEATVDSTRPHIEMLTLGSIAVGEVLVPRMIARGSGSLVFVGGGSARTPLRYFGNLGPAMAGMRHYALTLSRALRDTGVTSSFFTVAGMIVAEPDGPQEIAVSALAERLHQLVDDDRVAEVLMTPDGEVAVGKKS